MRHPFRNQLHGLRWKRAHKNRDYHGSKNPRAKLRAKDIGPIFDFWEHGWDLEDIAQKYEVGLSTIYKVIRGYTWKKVQ